MNEMCNVCLFIYHPKDGHCHLDCDSMRALWNDAMEAKPHVTAYFRMTQVHSSWFLT